MVEMVLVHIVHDVSLTEISRVIISVSVQGNLPSFYTRAGCPSHLPQSVVLTLISQLPIYSSSSKATVRTIWLRPWPLHSHIAGTLDRLPEIVEAVVHVFQVVHLKHLPDGGHRSRVVLGNCIQEHPRESSQLTEAVHLVEDGDAVNHSVLGLLSGGVVVFLPVGNVDETASVLVFSQCLPKCDVPGGLTGSSLFQAASLISLGRCE
jgi:hypothetical protein